MSIHNGLCGRWSNGRTRWRYPRGLVRTPCGMLKHHHGPEHFAPFHLVERLFNLIQGNSLRYEPFEVEPALQIQVDKHREIARGETVAIPRRPEHSASAKHL